MDFNKKIALFAISLFAARGASAGLASSLMETAPVKNPGEYEMKLQTDIIFNEGGGVNISPHFATGLVEHLFDVDAYFGTGRTGFFAGVTTKYNLLPDLPDQMGLSFLVGVSLLNDRYEPHGIVASDHPYGEDLSYGLLSFGILTSKDLQTDFGMLSPYAAFQPEFIFRSDYSAFAMDLALGAKWAVTNTAPWSFYSEFDLSLRKSQYALALGISYPF